MLLKLAITSAEDHVAQYKAKITHCDGNIKMVDYLKKLLLDNGENLKTENILEVLVGAGSFTDIRLFDTECMEHVSMDDLQKSLSKQGT